MRMMRNMGTADRVRLLIAIGIAALYLMGSISGVIAIGVVAVVFHATGITGDSGVRAARDFDAQGISRFGPRRTESPAVLRVVGAVANVIVRARRPTRPASTAYCRCSAT